MKLNGEEHQQRDFMNELHQMDYECFLRTFHVPNGGLRNKAVAAALKCLGVRAGVPDLITLLPRHGFTGLMVEFKDTKGKPSKEQLQWLAWARECGFMAEVVVGFDALVKIYSQYLSDDPVFELLIEDCSDVMRWYASSIGKRVKCLGRNSYEWKTIEDSGLVNFVLRQDARRVFAI